MINDFYNRFDNMEKAFRDIINAIIDTYDTKPAISTKPKTYKPISGAEKTINKEKVSERNIKLSPPWTTIYNKITAMFSGDKEIYIKPLKRTENECILIIESPSATKIDALERILKTTYNFGNIVLKIEFAVTNKDNKEHYDSESLYVTWLEALASTPAIVDIKLVENFVHDEFVVIEFKKEIVQFFNDDLTDYYGNWNGTYVNIAKEIFKENKRILFTIAEQ